jgi:hypothetical protein
MEEGMNVRDKNFSPAEMFGEIFGGVTALTISHINSQKYGKSSQRLCIKVER